MAKKLAAGVWRFLQECFAASDAIAGWKDRLTTILLAFVMLSGIAGTLASLVSEKFGSPQVWFLGGCLIVACVGGVRLAMMANDYEAGEDLTSTEAGQLLLTLSAHQSEFESISEDFDLLVRQQELVAQTMMNAGEHWSHKPYGFPGEGEPLHIWAAMVEVLRQRYPDRLVSANKLGITFQAHKKHSITCVTLVRRELQHPDWRMKTEPPETYLTELTRFNQSQRKLAS